MGKKRTRTKRSSKGLRPSMNPLAANLVRSSRNLVDVLQAKTDAWINGKNPWFTIENPNKSETNRLYIRVKADRYFGGTYKEIKSRFKKAQGEA